MLRRPLIIGQAPSRRSTLPFDAKSGARLAALANVPQATFLERVDAENVLVAYPGRSGSKGDRFPTAAARAGAEALGPKLDGRRVVFVGCAVARAFGFHAAPLLRWRWGEAYLSRFDFAVCPHPSGANRWWNDLANERDAELFWRFLLSESAEPA